MSSYYREQYRKTEQGESRRVCVCVTCPVQRPTTRSAIKVSSVSPERWLTITPQPFSWASLQLKEGNDVSLCSANLSVRSDVNSRLNGLGDRANLVHFEQQAVAGLFIHSLLYPARVCDC